MDSVKLEWLLKKNDNSRCVDMDLSSSGGSNGSKKRLDHHNPFTLTESDLKRLDTLLNKRIDWNTLI